MHDTLDYIIIYYIGSSIIIRVHISICWDNSLYYVQ